MQHDLAIVAKTVWTIGCLGIDFFLLTVFLTAQVIGNGWLTRTQSVAMLLVTGLAVGVWFI